MEVTRIELNDTLTAVAALTVILLLITVPLRMLLLPALGFDWGLHISAIVGIFISGLIGGYIFANKLAEARTVSIARITVFAAILMMFWTVNMAAFADWAPTVKQVYQDMYHPTTTPTAAEWTAIENVFITEVALLNVIFILVFGFIGLYIGSMLKKQAKS